jgi:hypothetical protein
VPASVPEVGPEHIPDNRGDSPAFPPFGREIKVPRLYPSVPPEVVGGAIGIGGGWYLVQCARAVGRGAVRVGSTLCIAFDYQFRGMLEGQNGVGPGMYD